MVSPFLKSVSDIMRTDSNPATKKEGTNDSNGNRLLGQKPKPNATMWAY